jgi:hypothetical protein
VGAGIYLKSSNNNRIYHNNFINNSPQARDDGSNYWDDGYPSGGNYWSDYSGVDENHGENQNIPGSDGIGDTPYSISDGSNKDRYPLIHLIDIIPPTAPALIWPAEGENINDNTPNLDWNNVSENSLPVLYRVYVALDPGFSFVGKDSGWITADSWEVSALIDGVYYWRVCAKDNAGNLGENSSARSFRVDTVAPAAPQLVGPADGANLNTTTPTLSWNSVPENSLLVLYYAAVSDNSSFPYENRSSGWITATSWIVSPELTGGVWYWRVQAEDNAGNVGVNSSSRSFMVPLWAGTATFKLENLYKISLEKNLQISTGSKLVVKFYTYGGSYQDNTPLENFTPPVHIMENENVSRPGNGAIQRVELVLVDNTGNTISTIASFVSSRPVHVARIGQINGLWPFLSEAQRTSYVTELGSINGLWPFSPETYP